jgi:hypothetical protein
MPEPNEGARCDTASRFVAALTLSPNAPHTNVTLSCVTQNLL